MSAQSEHRRTLRVQIAPSVGGSGNPVDCTVEATADTSVGELVALGATAGLWDAPIATWVARAARSGRGAEPHDPLAVLELRHGDLIEIQGAERTLAGALPMDAGELESWELAAVAGPSIGRRIGLGAAPVTVGRDEHCELPLSDPSLSGVHVRLERVGDRFTVTDLSSRNGTSLDGSSLPSNVPATVAPGAEIEVGRSVLMVRPIETAPSIGGAPQRGTVPVGRPPRLVPADLERTVEAPEVPDRPRGPRLPLIAAVVPLIGGVVMWQMTHQMMFLVFTVLSPVMLVGTYVSDRMSGRSDYKRALERARKDRADLAAEVAQDLMRERTARLDRSPDAALLLARAERVDHRLWERRAGHVDHLLLRIGLADQPSELRVVHPANGDEELLAESLAELPERGALLNVPATVSAHHAGVIGIAGPPAARDGLVRWLVAQLATLQSPRDVQLAAVLDPATATEWEWLKWLPHVREAAVSPALAATTLQVSQLLSSVAQLQADRALEQQRADLRRGGGVGPDLVLLIQDAGVHDRVVASELLARAASASTPVLWTADAAHELPGECQVLIELDAELPTATITDTRDRSVLAGVTVDELAHDLAERIAAAVAPLRDITQGDRGVGALPSIAHLADLEAIDAPTPDEILRRWAHPDGPATFTLGAGADGPLVLDLVAHGPHALVGGTPGAGKSELLRGLLASLALRYPPSRMTFLLVDFKGGAAFREFAALPHTVGIVTDLDEHLADRALTSFRAEIKYREALLEQHGAIDLIDLERRAPDVVLPRLLIVIDEFATLAQEVPAFVDGVIDVTQRGRSLGVHLVLATQSPRGSVTGKIRANTNLAIALRVVSADESQDILGTADAAAIPVQRKGRAWARIGDRDLVPFQSGYVGGNTFDAPASELRIERFSLDAGGARAGDHRAGTPLAADDLTDLERIAGGVIAAFEASEEAVPRAPWLPALPPVLSPPAVREPGTFAVADEPVRQQQRPVRFTPGDDGAMIVLGGPRSGKTTTLATIAAVLASEATTDELHVYGLDCAGRALAAVEALPHCGSVVPGDDLERTTRLLASLDRTLQRRRDLASQLGSATFELLQSQAPEPVPRVLVLVDDYGGFSERYERVEAGRLLDQLRTMISDGPAFGVHFVITADRRSAIPTSVSAAVPRRVIHRLADRDEYSRAGLSAKLADAEVPPGRGFDEDGIELQVISLRSEPAESLGDALARAAASMEPAHGLAPAAVRMLPAFVGDRDGPVPGIAWHAFFGLLETDVAPAFVSLEHGNFVIAGPYRSGRSTALGSLARGLVASTPGLELHLIAPRRSGAEAAAPWTSVLRTTEHSEVVALFETLIDRADAGTPVLVAIDDANEIDPTGMSGLERLLRQARDLPLRVVAAGESQALRTSYSPWHVQIRKDGAGVILNPNLELDGDLLGVRFPWRRTINFPTGRGMLIDAGTYDVVQVVGAPDEQ